MANSPQETKIDSPSLREEHALLPIWVQQIESVLGEANLLDLHGKITRIYHFPDTKISFRENGRFVSVSVHQKRPQRSERRHVYYPEIFAFSPTANNDWLECKNTQDVAILSISRAGVINEYKHLR